MKVNIGNREDKKLITDIAPGTCFLNRNDEGGYDLCIRTEVVQVAGCVAMIYGVRFSDGAHLFIWPEQLDQTYQPITTAEVYA